MRAKNLFLILLILFVTLSLSSRSFASDFRVAAMGRMFLIIEAVNNQLNLYDLGKNPAWLIRDQTHSYIQSFYTTSTSSGNFKRDWDAKSTLDSRLHVKGVKVLDQSQTFGGSIYYRDLRLDQLDQIINFNPYPQHPFRLLDTTSGNFHYSGPGLAFEYSRNLYRDKLLYGFLLQYSIMSGLKDHFPKPRKILRTVFMKNGLTYQIQKNLIIGITIGYANENEFTECKKYSQFDINDIKIIRLRSHSLGTKMTGEMRHYLSTESFQAGLQSIWNATHHLSNILIVNYNYRTTDAAEKHLQHINDGYWTLTGHEFFYQMRYRLPSLPFRIGLSLNRKKSNDWAKNPSLPNQLEDDYLTRNNLGFGVSYEPNSLPFIFGCEYHYSDATLKRQDYLSNMFAQGKMRYQQLKFGAELKLLQNWKIRSGYIFNIYKIDHNLLIFGDYLPEYDEHVFTFGLERGFDNFTTEAFGYFGRRKPTDLQYGDSRDLGGLIISVKYHYNN